MRHAEFRDPRLATVYDADFPWSVPDDFFVSVAQDTPGAARVLDLGCGTGRLSLGLAVARYDVTGVDPARASLDAARGKPGAADVTLRLPVCRGSVLTAVHRVPGSLTMVTATRQPHPNRTAPGDGPATETKAAG